jgi:hypothetical protein
MLSEQNAIHDISFRELWKIIHLVCSVKKMIYENVQKSFFCYQKDFDFADIYGTA